jgi:hypothetical protein
MELEPCVEPKLVPVTVTGTPEPTPPDEGERLVIVGPLAFTVKSNPELDKLATVTTKFPVVAPVGTLATI